MLTVDDYARIRRAQRDGWSIRKIAETFHHSRKTIRRILKDDLSQPQPYPKRTSQPATKLGPFHQRILDILEQDKAEPRKQRHTATRIFERLQQEGYNGAYDAVKRFVRKQRLGQRETFIPLDHHAGQRIEADFGQIEVDFPDGRRKVNVLILVWSFSNAPFAIALPTQRTEAILEGMSQAFAFFGCVPKEVWWDNPKTVAQALLVGRERKLNPYYAALASHYVFDPLFCMPARGNEKPVVENRVKTLERRWATPVPRVQSMDELNAYLRRCCLDDRERKSSGKTDTIGVRFEQDKAAASPLPKHKFQACIRQEAKVDKYHFARFDNVCYSVPRSAAFQTVTLKAFVDRIEIVHQNVVVARHQRSYTKGDQVLDPRHYLTTLQRRPAAVDHSNMYRDWKLPPVFEQLRQRLEDRLGKRAGVRQFVRVLQLLASHQVPRVQSAIEQLGGPGRADADSIIRRVEAAAAREQQASDGERQALARECDQSSRECGSPCECDSPCECNHQETLASSPLRDEGLPDEVLSVQVPIPDLSHFDQLIPTSPQGSEDDDQSQENPDASGGSVSRVSNEARGEQDVGGQDVGGLEDAQQQDAKRTGEQHDGEQHDAEQHTSDEQRRPPVAEVEPQATPPADDEGGVRTTGSRGGRVEPAVRAIPVATDGVGSVSPSGQHVEYSHQAGPLPRGEGLGQLRLLSVAIHQQTEGTGVVSLRLDFTTSERVSAGPTWHR